MKKAKINGIVFAVLALSMMLGVTAISEDTAKTEAKEFIEFRVASDADGVFICSYKSNYRPGNDMVVVHSYKEKIKCWKPTLSEYRYFMAKEKYFELTNNKHPSATFFVAYDTRNEIESRGNVKPITEQLFDDTASSIEKKLYMCSWDWVKKRSFCIDLTLPKPIVPVIPSVDNATVNATVIAPIVCTNVTTPAVVCAIDESGAQLDPTCVPTIETIIEVCA